jgi:hypothetical protein
LIEREPTRCRRWGSGEIMIGGTGGPIASGSAGCAVDPALQRRATVFVKGGVFV